MKGKKKSQGTGRERCKRKKDSKMVKRKTEESNRPCRDVDGEG